MHFAAHYRLLVYRHIVGSAQAAAGALATASLLDVGSRDGVLIDAFEAPLKIGIDLTPERFPGARPGAHFALADARALPFRRSAFERVVLSDVVEHIEDDLAAIESAAARVAPGGELWLSTTGAEFTLGAAWLTRRAERQWGHVRKGYRPETLHQALGPGFDVETIVWPEEVFRASYAVLWAIARVSMPLARAIATLCFKVDARRYRSGANAGSLKGHIYLRARKAQPA